jgi:sorbitol-specific phosphotransferase system component IIC
MTVLRQIGDYVMSIAGDYPLVGVVTSFLTVGVSFTDVLEGGLRLGTLALGFIAAGLTVIAKYRKNKRDKKKTP